VTLEANQRLEIDSDLPCGERILLAQSIFLEPGGLAIAGWRAGRRRRDRGWRDDGGARRSLPGVGLAAGTTAWRASRRSSTRARARRRARTDVRGAADHERKHGPGAPFFWLAGVPAGVRAADSRGNRPLPLLVMESPRCSRWPRGPGIAGAPVAPADTRFRGLGNRLLLWCRCCSSCRCRVVVGRDARACAVCASARFANEAAARCGRPAFTRARRSIRGW